MDRFDPYFMGNILQLEEQLNIPEAGHLPEGPEQLQGNTTPERLDQTNIAPGNYDFVSELRKVEDHPVKA